MNRRTLLLGAAGLAACEDAQSGAPPLPSDALHMRRGVNLGNALEAPNEGDWGYRIEADHLAAIADAGFDGIRLPVRWDAHAATSPPYGIDPAFFTRVTEVIEQALARNLRVQVDLHHYDALIQNPRAHRARFLALWSQIAQRYRDMPEALSFEPLNEPNGPHWPNDRLEAIQRDVVNVIREHNRERLIILGPGNWQNISALHGWSAPHDERVAVSVHYYEPHAFTHQNAEWLSQPPSFGRAWGTDADRAQVRDHFQLAADFQQRRGGAMQLGEFGVNRALPASQRAAWTRAVREECDARGFGWCVWDFAGAFPIFDRERRAFMPELRAALGL